MPNTAKSVVLSLVFFGGMGRRKDTLGSSSLFEVWLDGLFGKRSFYFWTFNSPYRFDVLFQVDLVQFKVVKKGVDIFLDWALGVAIHLVEHTLVRSSSQRVCRFVNVLS
jgi:hypothetical protein